MRLLFYYFILLLIIPAQAQYKYDYTWAFGYDCCRGDENDNFILNFNKNKVKIDTTTLKIEFFDSGQISNQNGELTLYTNGCKLYNGMNQMVQNGDSLIQSDSMPFRCLVYGRQGIVILPDNYNFNLYWIFYKSPFFRKNPLPGSNIIVRDAFRYSLVDMNENNGLGQIIKKNIPFIVDTSLVFGGIAAVKHENNKDWWIITSSNKVDLNYYIALMGKSGITEVKSQKIGNKINSLGDDPDGFIFSPDGNKLARFYHKEGLYLFDFDRKEGMLSNFKKIDFPNSGSLFGGIAFSPSGRFLYVATDTILYQYDFLETDTSKAMMVIDYFDYFRDFFYTTFYTAQLGPDCRIYLATNGGSRYLHVIKFPDKKGKACEFVQHGIKLPFYNDNYMPYFPNFRLGYAPVCDSTIDFITNSILPKGSVYSNVYPNPAKDQLHLEIELHNQSSVYFVIHDIHGNQMAKYPLSHHQTKYTIDIQNLPSGIYIYEIQSNEGMLRNGKIVKLE